MKFVYLSALLGFMVRLVKTDRFNALLAQFSIPPVPKRFLPWLALLLGAALNAVDARVGGAAWVDIGPVAFEGILAGATAIAGNETVVAALARVWPWLGRILGKEADRKILNVSVSPEQAPLVDKMIEAQESKTESAAPTVVVVQEEETK